MTKKQLTVLAVLILMLAIIGGWQTGKATSAQASEGSGAGTSHPQAGSTDPKAATWEYRILTSAVTSVVRVSYTDNKGRQLSNPGPYLEDEINKLVAQGYVVESFQTASLVAGIGSSASFSINGSSEILVLLKKTKK
jgi:hypothetical protein